MLDPDRYRLVPAAARSAGIAEGTLRGYVRRVPGLAVRRLGRIYVDVEALQQLLRPTPVVAAQRSKPDAAA